MRVGLTSTLLSGLVVAQSVTLPTVQLTPPGHLPFSPNIQTFRPVGPTHCQLCYDVNDIPVFVANWKSLRFRGSYAIPNPQWVGACTVVLSVSPNSFHAMSTILSSNFGSVPTTVFSGQISLPATGSVLAWPSPWQAPIVFTAPHLYSRSFGSSLVIDLQTVTTNTPNSAWGLEQSDPPVPGSLTLEWTPSGACKVGSGSYVVVTPPGVGPYIGCSLTITYSGLTPNTFGVGVLGSQGLGGSWSGNLLPIDLTPFGAPGCALAVAADVVVPRIVDGSGKAQGFTIAVPAAWGLLGQEFFEQAVFVDPLANALGVVSTSSRKWRISTGLPGSWVGPTLLLPYTATSVRLD